MKATVQMKSERGFTLLELLMVVIIIAILASIALPAYLRVSERSRSSEALTVLAAIRSAESRFRSLDPAQTYSVSLAALDIDVPGFGAVPASTMWAYAVSGAAAGSNAVATRTVGAQAGQTIQLDLDSGTTCSSATVYGLAPAPC